MREEKEISLCANSLLALYTKEQGAGKCKVALAGSSEPVRAVYLTQCECSALCRLFFITPRRVGSERQNYTCSIGCILTGVIRRLHIHLFAISLSNHEMRVVQFMILFFSIEN